MWSFRPNASWITSTPGARVPSFGRARKAGTLPPAVGTSTICVSTSMPGSPPEGDTRSDIGGALLPFNAVAGSGRLPLTRDARAAYSKTGFWRESAPREGQLRDPIGVSRTRCPRAVRGRRRGARRDRAVEAAPAPQEQRLPAARNTRVARLYRAEPRHRELPARRPLPAARAELRGPHGPPPPGAADHGGAGPSGARDDVSRRAAPRGGSPGRGDRGRPSASGRRSRRSCSRRDASFPAGSASTSAGARRKPEEDRPFFT